MLDDAPQWSGQRERKAALGDSRERTRIVAVSTVLTFRPFDHHNTMDNSGWLGQNWDCHARTTCTDGRPVPHPTAGMGAGSRRRRHHIVGGVRGRTHAQLHLQSIWLLSYERVQLEVQGGNWNPGAGPSAVAPRPLDIWEDSQAESQRHTMSGTSIGSAGSFCSWPPCPSPSIAGLSYGVQTTSARVTVHSLAGCFFYGAFVAKVLVVRSRRMPGWVLPVAGGVLVCVLAVLWYTSALWFFDGYRLPG